MKKTTRTYTPSRSGLMDFEPVSIGSSLSPLDDLPPDLVVVLDPVYGAKGRRAPLATDRALTGTAMDWFGTLPDELRPQATCDRYPRIVNAMAGAWHDVHARGKLFEHLLNDRRQGRRGFPIDVEREISSLCLYASALP